MLTQNYGLSREAQPQLDATRHIELAKDSTAYGRALSGLSSRQAAWRGHDRLPTEADQVKARLEGMPRQEG